MRLFVLLSRFPYPLEKGDKLRAYNHIHELSRHHEIYLCALTDIPIKQEWIDQVSRFCTQVDVVPIGKQAIYLNMLKSFAGSLPLQVAYFYHKQALRIIHSLIDRIKPDHIYCQLLRVAEYVIDIPIPKTIDYQDVFSQNALDRARDAGFPRKVLYRREYQRVSKYEEKVYHIFDNHIIISKQDRDKLNFAEKENIEVVPNGVDFEFFKPMYSEKQYDIAFIGNMQYPPNVDCAEYIVNEILPIVQKEIPGANLLLAGAEPVKRVRALESDNVKVSGWVDDIRHAYASARVFLAPMRMGTGLQNKLLESMAMGLPCVTSELANNALGASPEIEILVGYNAQEYAEKVVELIRNKKIYSEISKNGLKFVHKNYCWQALTEKLNNLIVNNGLIK